MTILVVLLHLATLPAEDLEVAAFDSTCNLVVFAIIVHAVHHAIVLVKAAVHATKDNTPNDARVARVGASFFMGGRISALSALWHRQYALD